MGEAQRGRFFFGMPFDFDVYVALIVALLDLRREKKKPEKWYPCHHGDNVHGVLSITLSGHPYSICVSQCRRLGANKGPTVGFNLSKRKTLAGTKLRILGGYC